jgi:hypothetical protein
MRSFTHLCTEFRRAVREILVIDHGEVEDLDQANLDDRALSGDGIVVFNRVAHVI